MPLSQKGFTLIELLLVVVLLLIVSAIAIPNFTQSFSHLKLRDTTNDIAYLMRYAQGRAIYAHQPLQLMFDEEFKFYWLELVPQSADELPEEETSDKPLTGRFAKRFEVPDEVKIETETSSITFTPDGRIEKTQINVCQEKTCLIISTENQSGAVVVAEEKAQ